MSKKSDEELEYDAREEMRMSWAESPYSRVLYRQLIEQEVQLFNLLVGAAQNSSDPAVVALAMRIVSARQFREHFEVRAEKVEKEDESK